MNKRLSFIPTAIIFIVTIILAGAFLSWILSTFDLPDWAMAVGSWLFWLFIFEVPARIGPQPFDTPLSRWQKLPARDRTILAASFVAFIIFFVISNILKDRFGLSSEFGLAILTLAILILICPFWFFGSSEAKKNIFSRNQVDSHPAQK